MGPSNCAVVKCYNSSKKLKDFCEKPCEVHAGLLKGSCGYRTRRNFNNLPQKTDCLNEKSY